MAHNQIPSPSLPSHHCHTSVPLIVRSRASPSLPHDTHTTRTRTRAPPLGLTRPGLASRHARHARLFLLPPPNVTKAIKRKEVNVIRGRLVGSLPWLVFEPQPPTTRVSGLTPPSPEPEPGWIMPSPLFYRSSGSFLFSYVPMFSQSYSRYHRCDVRGNPSIYLVVYLSHCGRFKRDSNPNRSCDGGYLLNVYP